MPENGVEVLAPHFSSQAMVGLNLIYRPGDIVLKRECYPLTERNRLLLWAQKVQRDLEIQDFTDPDVPTACIRILLCPTQGPDLGVADLTELRIQPSLRHLLLFQLSSGPFGTAFMLGLNRWLPLAFIVFLQCTDCPCHQPSSSNFLF